jgi:hypothetical protein
MEFHPLQSLSLARSRDASRRPTAFLSLARKTSRQVPRGHPKAIPVSITRRSTASREDAVSPRHDRRRNRPGGIDFKALLPETSPLPHRWRLAAGGPDALMGLLTSRGTAPTPWPDVAAGPPPSSLFAKTRTRYPKAAGPG